MAATNLGHEGISAFKMELLSQTATASDIIVSKMEEYLIKVRKRDDFLMFCCFEDIFSP